MKSLTEKITCPLNGPHEEQEAGSPPHPSRGGKEGDTREAPGTGKSWWLIVVLSSPRRFHIGSFPSPLRLIACPITPASRTQGQAIAPCTGGWPGGGGDLGAPLILHPPSGDLLGAALSSSSFLSCLLAFPPPSPSSPRQLLEEADAAQPPLPKPRLHGKGLEAGGLPEAGPSASILRAPKSGTP